MSLLAVDQRSANVIALEETELLRIDKNGLKPILESNPPLVESVNMQSLRLTAAFDVAANTRKLT